MIRIRLHGRGGQGIKTASQILGTASFLAGFQAQDFPLYGAERRGAPIVAFTRIDSNPILERGYITHPDLLLVGDETLLEDPTAQPLEGATPSTLIFINSTHKPEDLKQHFKLQSVPVSMDLTEQCMHFLGRRSVLSTALAAAGAKLLGNIDFQTLSDAVHSELGGEKLGSDILAKNLGLVKEVFETIPTVTLKTNPDRKPAKKNELFDLKLRDIQHSAPIILASANMGLRKTGNWRTHRPVIDYEQCNHCGICYLRCPEGDILIEKDGKPLLDYEHCKGCLICAAECPKQAIDVIREVTSWT